MKAKLPQRTASHVLDERARRAARAAFPPEWVVRELSPDYGADFHVEVFWNSLPTGFEFEVQLKATQRTESGGVLSVPIPWKTVRFLLQKQIPSMIVAFDGRTNKVYYRWLREYVGSLEFQRSPPQSRRTLTIRFPDTAELTLGHASSIIDYFETAGVPGDDLRGLLSSLPSLGVDDRYDVLQRLRFLRTDEGVLYLLSLLTLDLMLENVRAVEKSTDVVSAMLEICFTRLTAPGAMLFWGVVADRAMAEGHTLEDMTNRLIDPLTEAFLQFSVDEVAKETYELFGYSARSGLKLLESRVDHPRIERTVAALLPRLERMMHSTASRPKASALYANLYTVDMVDGAITFLSDHEAEELWRFYRAGRGGMKKIPRNATELDQHARGYFEALAHVYGYDFDLEEHEDDDAALLLSSAAVRKVDRFSQLVAQKEALESADRNSWNERELVQFAASDMFTFYKMFYFGRALDWFRLSCWARDFFHGGR